MTCSLTLDSLSGHQFIHDSNAYMPTDAVAFSSAHFGVGVGTIYLDEVGCTGHEIQLTRCPRSSSVVCRYAHSEDAGVRCQGLDTVRTTGNS